MDDSDAPAVTLAGWQVDLLRHVLTVGLAAHGEITRLVGLAEVFKDSLPAAMVPNDPTGDMSTTSQFAEALRCLDTWRPAG